MAPSLAKTAALAGQCPFQVLGKVGQIFYSKSQ